MWRRIIAYGFLVLGFLIYLFFRRHPGEIIPYPFVFYLIGVIMFFSALLFLYFTPSIKDIHLQKKLAEIIKKLKEEGERIQVDLAQCELVEHHYREEKRDITMEMSPGNIERKIKGWNALSGGLMWKVQRVHGRQTVIVFQRQNVNTGQMEKFVSRVLPKDKITLSFYFDKQQQTTLYVDKVNRDCYYFDLDFLFT